MVEAFIYNTLINKYNLKDDKDFYLNCSYNYFYVNKRSARRVAFYKNLNRLIESAYLNLDDKIDILIGATLEIGTSLEQKKLNMVYERFDSFIFDIYNKKIVMDTIDYYDADYDELYINFDETDSDDD